MADSLDINGVKIDLNDDGSAVVASQSGIKSYLSNDGSNVIEHPNGAKIIMAADGNTTFSMPIIEKVGIDNITNLKSISHSDDGKTLSFYAVFKDDSSVDFVCDLTTGTVQKLSIKGGTKFTIHKEPGVISFDMR